jgi:hypothetical protein
MDNGIAPLESTHTVIVKVQFDNRFARSIIGAFPVLDEQASE